MENIEIKTFLIVDNDEAIRSLLNESVSAFTKFCGSIIEASDGHDALQKIKDIDSEFIILTDHDMPNLNSIELIIKAIESKKNLIKGVLLISGRFRDNNKLKEIKSLLDENKIYFEFFKKPFSVSEIMNEIKNLTESK